MKKLTLPFALLMLAAPVFAQEKTPQPVTPPPAQSQPEAQKIEIGIRLDDASVAVPERLAKAAPALHAKLQEALKRATPAEMNPAVATKPRLVLKVGDMVCNYGVPGGQCEIDQKNCRGKLIKQLSDLAVLLGDKGEKDQAKIDAILQEIEKP